MNSIINNIKKLNLDQKISAYIVLSLIVRTINITISEVYLTNVTQVLLLKLFFVISYVILDLWLFINIEKKYQIVLVIFECVAFLLLTLTMFRYETIGFEIYLNYGWMLLSFIPIIIFIYSLNDFNCLYDFLYKSSFIITFLCTLIYFYHHRKISTNMVFSYTLLFPMLIHLVKGIENKNIPTLIILLFEFYMLLTYGARGTLVCFLIFAFIYFLLNLNKKYLKWFITVCIISALCLLAMYYFGGFEALYNYYLDKGEYSRLLHLLSLGSFFDNNGRFEIYQDYFLLILRHPILGWGIGADLSVGIFPHNIIIEIIFNFGLIVGALIIGTIVYFTYCSIIKANKSVLNLLIILSSVGILPLLFSFSYLEWMNFWIYIGVVLKMNETNLNKLISFIRTNVTE